MSVNCEVTHCKFATPEMSRAAYPAMVAHLQVHSAVKHGLPIGEAINPLGCSYGASRQDQVEDEGLGGSEDQVGDNGRGSRDQTGGGPSQGPGVATRPGRTASQPSRSRTPETRDTTNRGRSLSRSRGLGLKFPCTDCNIRSFDTETGLFTHRRKKCGLRGAKPTSLDFPCPSCPRLFSSPMGVNSHKRFCKGGGPHNPSTERRDSSSGFSRARVDIPKMRVEGGVEVGIAGAGENQAREGGLRFMKVVAERIDPNVEEGGSSKRKKSEMRLMKSSERGESLSERSSNRSEATTSAGRREAWVVVNSSGSTTNRAINLEEEDLPRKKVAMEVTMKLPGGQMATVMYRVGADAEMRKVVDKVANKLGKPASRVRLYISGSSALASSVVGGSSVVSSSSGASSTISFDGGSSSGSLSDMALVEGGSLAVRFQDMKLLAMVAEDGDGDSL